MLTLDFSNSAKNIPLPLPLSSMTKTVREVLELPISDTLKESLREYDLDWLVLLGGGKVYVAPPQDYIDGKGWTATA